MSGRVQRTRYVRRVPMLLARLRAPWIDRALAAGTVPWRSPTYAARALQLTSPRRRLLLARSLETLVEEVEGSRPARICSPIPGCRPQIRQARPLILMIASRLRSDTPVDPAGVARLGRLLSDGSGPCYMTSRPGALALALEEVDESLDVLD
ncbi:MAG TPA: hypothetical protein VFP55_01240 [Solirubrobacteraceae bacterium]|nr:hypothetical protein [Solirubrobacteraceae bacterium]